MVISMCIFSGRANSTENGPSAPGPKEILPVCRCRRMALILSAPPRAARTLATTSSAVCAAARGAKTAHNDNASSAAQETLARREETFDLFMWDSFPQAHRSTQEALPMLEVAATSVNLPRQFIASGVTSSRLLSYLLLDAR